MIIAGQADLFDGEVCGEAILGRMSRGRRLRSTRGCIWLGYRFQDSVKLSLLGFKRVRHGDQLRQEVGGDADQ